MLTKQKTYALCMFAHSRLSGKCNDTTTVQSDKMILDDEASNHVQKQVDKYVQKLEKEHFTVDILNKLPDNLLSKQLNYTYRKI
jgi:N-dimethylarginine dimethylaminohydrolase